MTYYEPNYVDRTNIYVTMTIRSSETGVKRTLFNNIGGEF
jgi:hypothetical protein